MIDIHVLITLTGAVNEWRTQSAYQRMRHKVNAGHAFMSQSLPHDVNGLLTVRKTFWVVEMILHAILCKTKTWTILVCNEESQSGVVPLERQKSERVHVTTRFFGKEVATIKFSWCHFVSQCCSQSLPNNAAHHTDWKHAHFHRFQSHKVIRAQVPHPYLAMCSHTPR